MLGQIFTPELDCPTCLEPFGEGKCLLAFAVAEQVQHECRHQGCTKKTPLDKIVQHEKECKWRLVLCPGAGSNCRALVPFCEVEDHVQECPDCEWPPFEYSVEGTILTIKYEDYEDHIVWATETTEFDGKLFFCRKFKENGTFTVDVVMKGSLE